MSVSDVAAWTELAIFRQKFSSLRKIVKSATNFHFELIFAICKGLNVFFRVEVDVCREMTYRQRDDCYSVHQVLYLRSRSSRSRKTVIDTRFAGVIAPSPDKIFEGHLQLHDVIGHRHLSAYV